MESFLLSIAPGLITLAGTILVALAGWGIALLRQKVKSDLAKSALDQIDQIVGTVVGNVAQTSAKQLKAASKDGHLSKIDKSQLKIKAFNNAKFLISKEIKKAATKSISSLDAYVDKKIEERVLWLK